MNIYMYTYIHIHIYTSRCIHIHVYIYICIYIFNVYTYVYTHFTNFLLSHSIIKISRTLSSAFLAPPPCHTSTSTFRGFYLRNSTNSTTRIRGATRFSRNIICISRTLPYYHLNYTSRIMYISRTPWSAFVPPSLSRTLSICIPQTLSSTFQELHHTGTSTVQKTKIQIPRSISYTFHELHHLCVCGTPPFLQSINVHITNSIVWIPRTESSACVFRLPSFALHHLYVTRIHM